MSDYTYAAVMAGIHDEIQADYRRLRGIAKDDPQRAGHGGEELWKRLLTKWLPPAYKVDTRKYIVPEDRSAPFETDIVVFRPSCPEPMRLSEAVLAGGLAAAFSVKTTLLARDLPEEIRRATVLRRSLRPREGSPRGEILPPFPYGILAHSHGWKRLQAEDENPLKTRPSRIAQALVDLQLTEVRHPRELLDFVCVADTATWTTQRISHLPPAAVAPETPDITPGMRENGVAITALVGTDGLAYSSHGTLGSNVGSQSDLKPPPVAAFITALLIRLSYEDPTIAPIATSLRVNDSIGFLNGASRFWDLDAVYSQNTRLKLPHLGPDILLS